MVYSALLYKAKTYNKAVLLLQPQLPVLDLNPRLLSRANKQRTAQTYKMVVKPCPAVIHGHVSMLCKRISHVTCVFAARMIQAQGATQHILLYTDIML